MIKKKSIWLIVISIILGLFLFAGCSGTEQQDQELNDVNQTEETGEEETSEINNQSYLNAVDNLTEDLDMVQDNEANASGSTAANYAQICDEVIKEADLAKTSAEHSLAKDYLTQEEKDSLDTSFEDIKSRANTLKTSLTEKAQGATVSDEDSQTGIAQFITSKDQFEEKLNSYKDSIDHLDNEAKEATLSDKDYLKSLSENYRMHLDQLESRLSQLVTDGTIAEDAKQGYQDTIKELKDALDSADATIEELK